MMTIENIGTMLELLETAYGESFYKGTNREKTLRLWSVMFRDDEPKEVLIAVKSCIATLQYPPKVADIKSRIAQNRMAGQLTEMEAWSKIREAVKNACTSVDANTAFLCLPEILQKCVGTPSQLRSWHGVSADTFEGVIASNVQRNYRELARREATYNALPKDMQAAQNWMVEEPKNVTMLPEPAEKSIGEIIEEANDKSAENRNITMTNELKGKHADRVSAFLTPLTDAELKMQTAKEKAEEKNRLERMRP